MATGVSREKRPLCEAEFSKSQKSRVESGMSTLPVEMLENIARYLPDKDLRAFGQTYSACRNVALRERTLRLLTTAKGQVGQLSNLNPTFLNGEESSPIRWYITFLAEIRRYELNTGIVVLPINEQVLESLNQSLRAITIERLADRVLGLKNEIFKEINKKTVGWDDIDKLGHELQLKSLLEALNAIIGASPDADSVRGLAVLFAVEDGHINIARSLLANGPISEDARSCGVMNAALLGNSEIVQELLAHGPISEDARSWAVGYATSRGCLEIVQELLAHGPISEEARSRAVVSGARNGYLEIVQELLANGPILDEMRGSAFEQAAAKGHLEIVQELLASGSISLSDRYNAIKAALQNGNYRIVSELLHAKAILATAFLRLTASYINSLQYQDEQ